MARHYVSATLWLLWAGCAPAEEQQSPLGRHEQPMLGGTRYAENTRGYGKGDRAFEPHVCSPGERAYGRQMFALGRMVVRSDAFAQCIEHGVATGAYRHCKGDPRGDDLTGGVLAAARNPNPVKLVCTRAGLTITDRYGHGGYDYIGSDLSEIEALKGTAFEARMLRLANRAGLAWHEGLHTWGYDDCSGYRTDATVLAQGCVSAVLAASLDHCEIDRCPASARLALIDSYKPNSDDELPARVTCECVRDAVGPGGDTEDAPARKLGQSHDGDRYGASMVAGDFDGDGFDDLAVGAPGDQRSAGAVLLYRGTTWGLYPWRRLIAPLMHSRVGDEFGRTLAAGDFDADGLLDLVVGAPGLSQRRGAVFVYRAGQDGLRLAQGLRTDAAEGAAADSFGTALAVGKLDSEERDVLLAVGAPGVRDPDSGASSGAVYLFGGARRDPAKWLEPLATVRQPNLPSGQRFGASLAFGRSATREKRSALIVGAPQRLEGVSGAVFIVERRAGDRTYRPTMRIEPPARYGERTELRSAGMDDQRAFGSALAVTNLFGADTLVVTGARLVHLFAAPGQAQPEMALEQTLGQLDGAIGSAGPDTLVLADIGLDGGRVFLYRVSENDHSRAERTRVLDQTGLARNETGDLFGYAVASGDFDGDGDDDLAVGAPGKRSANGTRAGAVFLFQADDDALTAWQAARQDD